jgi:hypothetical protein
MQKNFAETYDGPVIALPMPEDLDYLRDEPEVYMR